METVAIDKTAISTAHPQETVRLNTLIDAYLQEYEVRQFRVADARGRVRHVRAFFGDTNQSPTSRPWKFGGIKWHVGSRAPRPPP